MKKLIILGLLGISVTGCSILQEMTALSRCEFSLQSVQNPVVGGVEVSSKQSFSDFSLLEGQALLTQIVAGSLPFSITMNVEARNPGATTAAVNSLDWIAFIDDIRISSGRVDQRVEVAPGGATALIPVRVETDLIEFLEGDNPRTLINFALNLYGAGAETSRLTLKIKPVVTVAGQPVSYPGYFTVTREFRSGS